VLDDLTAANEARARRLQEQDEWVRERQRMELLQATIGRETERAEDAAAASRQTIRDLEQNGRVQIEERRKVEALRSLLDRLSGRIHAALTAIEKACPPGVIPGQQPQSSATAEMRFLKATDLLAQAKRESSRAGVEIVSGLLDGEVVTVRLLRLGGIACWWRSLDGKQSGRAAVSEGELRLSTVTADEGVSIGRAFDMVVGRSAPGWVVLHVEREAGQ